MKRKEIGKKLKIIDDVRVNASLDVRNKRQQLNEQYFTPAFVSEYLSKHLVDDCRDYYNILDVAAGVGNIVANVAIELKSKNINANVNICAVEIDEDLSNYCAKLFNDLLSGINVDFEILNQDFFCFYKASINNNKKFTTVVMNPPYKKFSRKEFDSINFNSFGVEYSPNLYSLMISCSLDLLVDDGELIAIIPRSFCSGPQFKKFREKLLKYNSLEFIHLFESRTKVFSFDRVRQETVIIKIKKGRSKLSYVKISYGDELNPKRIKNKKIDEIVFPNDKELIIHIPHHEVDDYIIKKMLSYTNTLDTLGLKISTGKIVDFRSLEHLRFNKEKNAWLFCKENLEADQFLLPIGNKPNFIEVNELTRSKMLDFQCHLVLNRIYFKERRQVIFSQVVEINEENVHVAVENHLNYISGKVDSRLSYDMAMGLKNYLESDLVSSYFKRFIGSTQINASDIKALPFPSKQELLNLSFNKGI